jgi:hypothetical protein
LKAPVTAKAIVPNKSKIYIKTSDGIEKSINHNQRIKNAN